MDSLKFDLRGGSPIRLDVTLPDVSVATLRVATTIFEVFMQPRAAGEGATFSVRANILVETETGVPR